MQEGQQFGPYTKVQLESFLWDGTVQREDLAWHEGLEDWSPLWQVLGLDAPTEAVEEPATAEPEPVSVAAAPATPVEPAAVPSAEEAIHDGRPKLVIPGASAPAAPTPPAETSTGARPALGGGLAAAGPRLTSALQKHPRLAQKVGGSSETVSTAFWRWLASPTILFVGLCLLLPFLSITCQHAKLATVTGQEVFTHGQAVSEAFAKDLPSDGLSAEENLPLSESLVKALIMLTLGAAGLVSICGIMAAISPTKGFAKWGLGAAVLGILAHCYLGYHLGVETENQLLAQEKAEAAAEDETAMAMQGLDMMNPQLDLDAGYWGALAFLFLGAGACATPAFRGLTEGGAEMMVAVSLWIIASMLGSYAFFHYQQKPMDMEGFESMMPGSMPGMDMEMEIDMNPDADADALDGDAAVEEEVMDAFESP